MSSSPFSLYCSPATDREPLVGEVCILLPVPLKLILWLSLCPPPATNWMWIDMNQHKRGLIRGALLSSAVSHKYVCFSKGAGWSFFGDSLGNRDQVWHLTFRGPSTQLLIFKMNLRLFVDSTASPPTSAYHTCLPCNHRDRIPTAELVTGVIFDTF